MYCDLSNILLYRIHRINISIHLSSFSPFCFSVSSYFFPIWKLLLHPPNTCFFFQLFLWSLHILQFLLAYFYFSSIIALYILFSWPYYNFLQNYSLFFPLLFFFFAKMIILTTPFFHPFTFWIVLLISIFEPVFPMLHFSSLLLLQFCRSTRTFMCTLSLLMFSHILLCLLLVKYLLNAFHYWF